MKVDDLPIWRKVKLRSALDPNIKVLQILGYWPPEHSSNFIRLIYLCYAFAFVGSIFALYIVTEVVNIVMSMGDLEKITAASFLLLTHVAQVFKLYFFSTNNKRIKKLLDDLERDIFKPKNLKQHKMLKRAMFQSTFTFYMFISMSLSTCLLWGIFPLIDSGDENQRALPLSAYYPFSTENTPIYELIYSYQIIATGINAATNVSMDTIASGFMSHICGQLDMLNDTLIHIKEFGKEAVIRKNKNKAEKNQIENEDELVSNELEAEMNEILITCVKHHTNILEMAAEVGDLFHISVLSQFAAGSIIICITMFELTLVSILSLQFVSMVLYQGCMLVEIILYCWFGNEIILKSSQLSVSAYRSNWTHCRIPYKKQLLFLMLRSNLPIKLYAGNIFTLSVETFVAILRSSWSYFAVLYRVHQE